MGGRDAAVTMLAAVIVAMLVTGCSAFGMSGSRGPVSLAGEDVVVIGGTTLDVTVRSCDGDPELSSLVQDDESVTVEVVTTIRDDGPACAEGLRIDLEEPLGDRRVIDATSGRELQVSGRH